MKNIITLKEFRTDVAKYAEKIAKGETFIVMKRSQPIFRLEPVTEEAWEELIDFTKIKKGGVKIDDILSRL